MLCPVSCRYSRSLRSDGRIRDAGPFPETNHVELRPSDIGTIPPVGSFLTTDVFAGGGASMSVHQATDDFGIFSIDGTAMGGSRPVARERVPVCQDRSRGVSREAPIPRVDTARMPAKVERQMTRVRVIEGLDGRPKTLLGDYYFAELPQFHAKITV